MKLAFYISFFILVLIALIPAVSAGSENINNISGLTELPEMDMTGLHRDIPLIEIDPEIMNATLDWIVLVHDEDGKKSLLDDINRSSVSIAEKTDTKNALETLWATYPVKFEPVGEKSIEIVVQSDKSNRTISIPIGHVTRISFDREKMGKSGDSSIIVLPEAINQTIRNISMMRVNNITATPTREVATSGSVRSLSSPGNSFSSRNSIGSGLSASSGHALDSSFPSSGNDGRYSGNGLVAWQGDWDPTVLDTDPSHDSGHNSYVYWACKHLNYTNMNDAAATAMAPDVWPQEILNPPIFGMTDLLKGIFADIVHSWSHWYNPDYPEVLINGFAPMEAEYFADISHAYYSSGNNLSAAHDLGHANHFMTDVANPMHTGQELNQVIDKIIIQIDTHAKYEQYVSDNWNSTSTYKFGEIVKNNTYYYRVRSPNEATINIATFSHAYVDTLYYKVKNQPGTGFYSDPVVKSITENCVLIAARYTGGLVKYTQNTTIAEIPIADFDANPKSGSAPLSVHFTDRTHYYGALQVTYNWSFGDGEFSSERVTPDHTYQNNGNYMVVYNVSTVNGLSNKTMIISVGTLVPQADFNYATVDPSTIHFTDRSANSPTSWVWDFGDGSNASVEQNPTHQYSGARYPTVRLDASNVYGSTIKTEVIAVMNPWPSADFIPSSTTGPSPLLVQFTDNSTNYADNWSWDFGDNSPVSYQRNTSHTFNNPGNYSVALKASNSYGNTTSTKAISVTPPPLLVNFTATPRTGIAPLAVSFTDTSTGLPISWNWTFGDGDLTNATEQNPVHTYQNPGNYTVSLRASNVWENATKTQTSFIRIAEEYPYGTATGWNTIAPTIPMNAFDNNITSFWVGDRNSWIIMDYGPGISHVINQYTISADPFSGVTGPHEWKLHGSIDGTTWTELDYEITSDWNGNLESRLFTFPNENSYRYYRFWMWYIFTDITPRQGFHELDLCYNPVIPPYGNFTAEQTTGTSPLTVQFTDTSTGSPDSWNWSFGDGSPGADSSEPGPHL